MKTRILLSVFVLCCCKKIIAQPGDSIRQYIDSALYFLQTKALNGKNVNWKQVRDSAYLKASDAQTYKDAFPALAYAFRQLKDYHGMVANEDTFYRYPPPVNFAEVLSPGIKKEFSKGQRIITHFLPGSIAYLRVPGMNVTRQKDMDERANKLRDSL
ncbi:MAG TPA: hypothetical protein VM935_08390, partial [Chitinophagaceae bacterium]|nr:hypothetical protein [Chitinophagaceae bacterium]